MQSRSQVIAPVALRPVPRPPTAAAAARVVRMVLAAVVAFVAIVAQAAELPTITVQPGQERITASYDGQVEALRQAELAVQVAGSVVELEVRAGDTVRAGQLLLRVDARAAEQGVVASGAQVAAAQAALDLARTELTRKRQLAEKQYISQGALELAESEYRAARAQLDALSAQAGVARTQAGLHALRAPFDGVISQLAVELGDMAMPGRALVTVYDPGALRVTAHVPASRLEAGLPDAVVLLSTADAPVTPTRLQVLPTVDPRTLTREVRADLPAGAPAVPGQFARLRLEVGGGDQAAPRLFIPRIAVVRRAEVSAVYVMAADGRVQLRQLRLGPVQGDRVEVLAGLDAGERVVTDPQAATRAAAGQR